MNKYQGIVEKPILFNTEMVKAILEGRKTTRRIIKGIEGLDFIGVGIEPKEIKNTAAFGHGNFEDIVNAKVEKHVKAPYLPDDILYVRETWMISNPLGDFARDNRTAEYMYKAGYSKGKRIPITRENEKNLGAWKPSIHMPKGAARIFLKVTDVRIEKLHDMTTTDATKEGFKDDDKFNDKGELLTSLGNFSRLWDTTIKEDQLKMYGWSANPYVWVIEFEITKK
jgi:hypothetical protein